MIFLFQDSGLWSTIDVPLVEMKLDEIVFLIRKLDINEERLAVIEERIRSANLNGLVLSACDLSDVERSLAVSFSIILFIRMMIPKNVKCFLAVPFDSQVLSLE